MKTFILDEIKYQIDRDNYCWTLSKCMTYTEGKYVGKEYTTPLRYFAKYKHLAEYLLERHVKFGDLEEFNSSLDAITSTLEKQLCQ